MRSAFPLQWPEGWKRTPYFNRGTPRFESRFVEDRDAVLRRLERRGASNVVITSFLPTNTRGQPYIGPVEDPGIAVYWFERRKSGEAATELVLACDCWARVADNMRAIAKSLEALDGLDRWGASQVVERAFAGFAALPPGASGTIDEVSKKKPWRDVLEPIGGWPELERDELLALAKFRHRKLIAQHHPDAGGNAELAAELNVALADAEKELTHA